MSYKHRGARRASERERKTARLCNASNYTLGCHDHYSFLATVQPFAVHYYSPRRQRKPACTGPWATYNRARDEYRYAVFNVDMWGFRIVWDVEVLFVE